MKKTIIKTLILLVFISSVTLTVITFDTFEPITILYYVLGWWKVYELIDYATNWLTKNK